MFDSAVSAYNKTFQCAEILKKYQQFSKYRIKKHFLHQLKDAHCDIIAKPSWSWQGESRHCVYQQITENATPLTNNHQYATNEQRKLQNNLSTCMKNI